MPAADGLSAADTRVARAYVTPGHPTAYSAPATVAKHWGIGRARAKRILEHIEGYTLHREYKQPRVYNPYYVRNRRKQIQADLIDVGRLATHNDGVKFLLLLIDIFTKRVWVLPLKSKSARVVKAALSKWFDDMETWPEIIMTDRGLEFTNRPVQDLLRENDVEWQPAFGTLKAAIAERANKSIQILMYKHLTEGETLRYVDALPGLVESYNGRGHRTLEGMTPDQADRPGNEARVQAIFHARYARLARHRKTTLPFRVGDLVRLKTLPKKSIGSSARAYAEQFHGEYYRIVRINRTLPIALYYLRSLDTGEFIEGGLYANELQRQRGDVYKIESVLRERTRGGRRELLVKWKNFGPRWNEWIRASQVQRVF